MSGGVGSSRRFPSGNIRFKVMARLILNCEGVGLIMRELSRDIVMIGRSPFSAKILGILATHYAEIRAPNTSFFELVR
jgi:hypothetical protein